ncbi:putative Ig domain-containing protein [Streptosporangium sp. H16]|uniref:putative Ig domain-containing protein n=1 Tax=Streptosporangium sp. H16 TaxID=3444184 RepID=UPI003F7AD2F2
MRGKRGFPGIGAIVAGAVVCGVLATPRVALAIPVPDPPPAPAPVQAQAPSPAHAPAPVQAPSPSPSPVQAQVPAPAPAQAPVQAPVPAPVQASVRTSIGGGTGRSLAGGSSSLSAHPSLGHFGAPVDRPLRGRVTLAGPTGETIAFRLVNPALLPAGITLDADGLLGGASRVPGTWTVPVEACVASGGCATGTVTITITCECARSLSPASSLADAPCSDGDSGGDVTTA